MLKDRVEVRKRVCRTSSGARTLIFSDEDVSETDSQKVVKRDRFRSY